MAALWEYQETEVEGVHLALALAYHGLLRIPTRAETSDMTPRKYSVTSKTNYTFSFFISVPLPKIPTRLESINHYLAIYPPIREDGCQGSFTICLLCHFV